MNKELLIKYLNNNCNEDEFLAFSEWVKTNAPDKETEKWIFAHWRTYQPPGNEHDRKKYSALLDKIHHEINLKESENKKVSVIRLPEVINWISRVAAVLFLPLLGVMLYLLTSRDIQNGNNYGMAVDSLEVIAPVGSRTVVQLADGSVVHLNYGSFVKYPRIFRENVREISLSGEAYINVAHHPEKPFTVKTGKLNITALGTEFNVRAYPDEQMVATTLITGKVRIDKTFPGADPVPLGTMVPGQHVQYSIETGNMKSHKGKVDSYIAWKDGKMVFDNTPITDVIHELRRKFNVDIEVADEIRYLTYTVTFSDDPLYLILDLMTETTPIKYKRFPRVKLADGSFSKQKISIEKK